MNPVVLIPSRYAATRLPGKPLADIGGKAMIVHVWERAVSASIGPVVVACDDARIKAAIESAGGTAVMTRTDHASGSDRIFEALQAIDPQGAHDVVVNLQGDMPTLDPAVVKAVLTPLADSAVDIATLVAEIRDESERDDPVVVKAVMADSRKALYFSRAAIPYGAGPLYHHIGIYAYRRAALTRFVQLPPSPLEQREKLEQLRALEAGMHLDVHIVDTVPLGVDTPETLEKARKWHEQQQR